ncbi:unnamed protein product, partial [Heterosigma akashiwo]
RCRQPYSKVLEFYRINFHERRNKKHVPSLPQKHHDANNNNNDALYTLKSRQGEIVAALRLTKSKNDEQYTFLRSMCVSREHRRHGLASRLLEESLQQFDAHHCYCFASPELDSFYQKAGFTSASCTETITSTPKWMVNSFESMANRNRHKELKLYIKDHSPSSESAATSTHNNNSTEIVLLQHCSEISKKTATGWLLNDTKYSNHFGNIPTNGLVGSRLKSTIWAWGGSNDITMIEEQIIKRLKENRTVYLLWTGGATTNETGRSGENDNPGETYIIIDGTWQKAKKIYRKIPLLWSLPRISFTNVPPSIYVLRGDSSGWRERFSNNDGDGGDDLLCTAEVAAAVMDRCGDTACANVIRSRLDAFQSTFPHVA